MERSQLVQKELDTLRREASKYRPTMAKFIRQNTGLCLDTLLIWVLFFSLGLPTAFQYGYSTETDRHKLQAISKSPDGAIPSGVYGSGVFPYSLFLFLVATFFLFKELYCFFRNPSIGEMERRLDEMMLENRIGSMKQMSTLHREDMMSIGTEAASLNPVG